MNTLWIYLGNLVVNSVIHQRQVRDLQRLLEMEQLQSLHTPADCCKLFFCHTLQEDRWTGEFHNILYISLI